MPLHAVELKIAKTTRLPYTVCHREGVFDSVPPSTLSFDAGAFPLEGPFPDPNDPGLICDLDGRAFTYLPPCTTDPNEAYGLCGIYFGSSSCPPPQFAFLPPGASVPPGWPCPVTIENDGSVPYEDGGMAEVDASIIDGGGF